MKKLLVLFPVLLGLCISTIGCSPAAQPPTPIIPDDPAAPADDPAAPADDPAAPAKDPAAPAKDPAAPADDPAAPAKAPAADAPEPEINLDLNADK